TVQLGSSSLSSGAVDGWTVAGKLNLVNSTLLNSVKVSAGGSCTFDSAGGGDYNTLRNCTLFNQGTTTLKSGTLALDTSTLTNLAPLDLGGGWIQTADTTSTAASLVANSETLNRKAEGTAPVLITARFLSPGFIVVAAGSGGKQSELQLDGDKID